MKKTRQQLQDEINILAHDPIWGCYTRPACELYWNEFTTGAVAVVYMDIDHMHDLNAKYGHEGTDSRIRGVIANVRHGERGNDIVASRWLNGDELVFILKSGDPYAFCARMKHEFGKVGISVTQAFTFRITSPFETVSPLDEMVNEAKNKGLRGSISL